MSDRAYIEDRIARYFHRGDFTDDDFDGAIRAATKEIGNVLRSQYNELELNVLAVDWLDPFTMPDDFRSVRGIEFDGLGGPHSLVSSSRAHQNRFSKTSGGDPKFYTILAGFDVHVRPFKAKDFTIWYFAEPAEIGPDGSDTNPVLTAYPQLYLYRTALEIALITQDVELAQGYDTLFNRRVGDINQSSKNARAGNAPVQQGV